MFDLKALLSEGVLILDGAAGTNLQKAGMPSGVCPEIWMLDHPEAVIRLQKAYVKAGSRVIYAPTFSSNRIKLQAFHAEDRLEEINERLVGLSREAAGSRCYVAGNMTMTGQALKPAGSLEFEALVDCYKEQVRAILKGGVDLFAIETMMSLGEARAAVLAVKETCDLPVFVTMTFEPNGSTLYGSSPVSALIAMEALGVDAFGINCACGPSELLPMVEQLKKYAQIPLIVKPNAGMPRLVNGQTVFDMPAEAFAAAVKRLVEAGASIAGGCCGSDPSYIRFLSEAVMDIRPEPLKGAQRLKRRILSSERGYMELDLQGAFHIIGERINPTGKAALQAELKQGSMELVSEMALSQVENGAALLDINVGMGGIDEKAMMQKAVETVSENTDVPLCIDSSSPEVVEAALRHYHGRALVNSISGEAVKLKLLPIVKKYGAMFILLPLTDAGIPESVSERIDNINRIMEAAERFGFCREDVIVDGLAAAAGAQKGAALDTLSTIEYSKSHGFATVCGLSNISFGLPDRSYVNSTFLALAISRGLTLAIANPSQQLLMRTGFAADLLLNKEGADLKYIEVCGRYQQNEKLCKLTGADSAFQDQKPEEEGAVKLFEVIGEDVLKGRRRQIAGHLEEALRAGHQADSLLNEVLIPSINLVGDYFNSQKYFLPQLIMSAEAMRCGVAALEPLLMSAHKAGSGPCVVIATVKGDIHDIGKNLVAMMMKNYGFKVIDLGKDVPKEAIIQAAIYHRADIIALSALMTTTMREMKAVIELARGEGIQSKIIIGGAAVTADYAEEIGADGYSEDAVGAVGLVKRLTGKSQSRL